ncbi:MAG: phosphopantetheine-protein transferase [Bacteriovoracaceae bacterium]|nr:phosphopantetheine-protein transferase [Bacteriovoracaceae bacterium]
MRDLKKKEVELWFLDSSEESPDLPDVLSIDELTYADKLSTSVAKENYKRSRNQLRWLLSAYLDTEPKLIRFSYGAHGKPMLFHPKTRLQFNLSHSKDSLLFAFSLNRVGIDIEKMDDRKTFETLAEKYFSKNNQKMLASLSEKNRIEFFFKIWTASEAYIKGQGESAFLIEKIRELIAFKKNGSEFTIGNWSICSLHIKKEYAASLAVEMKEPEIKILSL